ncbi:T9SS type A sorting domain-containing protein [bacterium]|nr:T9SS type A sorting domain-containing protein [bacterium]
MNRTLLAVFVLVCCLIAALFADRASAQERIDITLAGSINYPHWEDSEDVAVSGDFAFVVCGTSGLRVLDVSDPAEITEAASLDLPGTAERILLDSDYAYITCSSGGVRIIDISDPYTPVEVADWVENSYPRGIDKVDDLLYVGWSGVTILDVSDPTSPTLVGSCELVPFALDLDVNNGYAYVANYQNGIRIVDVSDPENPVEVGSLEGIGSIYDVEAHGDYLYATAPYSNHDFQVIDVSNPSNPVEVGYRPSTATIQDFTIRDHYAYLVEELGGLRVLDITDPTSPTSVKFYNLSDAYGISLVNDQAFIANGYICLKVMDITDPQEPFELGDFYTPEAVCDVVAGPSGNHQIVYALDKYRGIMSIDVSDPENPIEISSVEIGGYSRKIYYYNNHLLVPRYEGGLVVVEIQDDNSLDVVGVSDYSSSDIDVNNHYAYLPSGDTGLFILDLSDIEHPVQVGVVEEPTEGCARIDFAAGYAYGTGGEGFYVFNVQDATHPYQEAFYEINNGARDVAVRGDYAYVVYNYTLHIFDISDPTNLTTVGMYVDDIDNPYSITLHGNLALIGDWWQGVQIYDISDPLNCEYLGQYNTPGYTDGIAGGEGFIYVADDYYFHVLECADFTGVAEHEPVILPGSVTLSPAYPNPFNAATTTTLFLPTPADVQVTVYNLAGQKVAVLADQRMQAGQHRLSFDALSLASGTYFLKARLGGEAIQTNKITLIR